MQSKSRWNSKVKCKVFKHIKKLTRVILTWNIFFKIKGNFKYQTKENSTHIKELVKSKLIYRDY